MKRKAKTFALIAIPCVLLLLVGLFIFRYLQDSPTPSPKASVTVYVSANRIELDGKAVSSELLASELKRLKQDNPAIEVFVTTRNEVTSIGPVMDVIDQIGKAGIEKVAFLTKPSPSPTPAGEAPIS